MRWNSFNFKEEFISLIRTSSWRNHMETTKSHILNSCLGVPKTDSNARRLDLTWILGIEPKYSTANGAHLKWIKNHVYIHSSLAGKTGLHFFQKYSLKKLGQTFESRTKERMLIIMRPLDNYILLFYDLKPTWKQLSQSQHLVRNALKSLNINLFSSPVFQRWEEKVGFLFKKNLLAMKHLIITEKRLENGHWLEAQVIIKESKWPIPKAEMRTPHQREQSLKVN